MARLTDRNERTADNSISQLVIVEPKHRSIGSRMQSSQGVLNLRDSIRIHQDLPTNNGRVGREMRHAGHHFLVRKLAEPFGTYARRIILNGSVKFIGPKLSDEVIPKDNGDVGCAGEQAEK